MENLANLYNDALAALNRGNLAEAERLFRRVLKIQRDHVPSLNLLTVVLMSMERFAEAEQFIARAVKLNPSSDVSFYNFGLISKRLKKPDQALTQFDRALALNDRSPETWNNRGTVLNDLGRYDHAIADFEHAIRLDEKHADAYANKAKALAELNRHDEATAFYERALALRPGLAEAWLGLGNVLSHFARHDEAMSACDRALALNANLAGAWLGRANASTSLKRYDEAFAAYRNALALQPDLAAAWLGCGNASSVLKRYEEAFAAYDHALALEPDLAEAWLGRGNLFGDLDRCDDAIDAYGRALELKPDLGRAWLARGNVLTRLNRHAEAIAAYDRALEIKPDLETCEGVRLRAKMWLCDWEDFDEQCSRLLAAVRGGVPALDPLTALAVAPSPADQLTCSKLFVAEYVAAGPAQRAVDRRRSHERIRLAYVSPDFRDHPVSFLTVGMLEQHDKSRFDVFAISLSPDRDSAMRSRIKRAVSDFIDIGARSDAEVVELLRELDVDIAIDLAGLTQGARPNILAQRVAPIQVNYLGHPGTVAAPYIDYIVADRVVIPPEARRHYSERVVYLPDCFQANDARRRIAERSPARSEAGLPEDAFVFCVFHSSYKLNPQMFGTWMNLLRQVAGSVLWLVGGDQALVQNLRREAETRAIDPDRLIFAPRLPYADHLARHRIADLFLDTFPFNGGTTTSDALWAGLPLVTLSGESFAARMSASLLNAVGLPGLAVPSLAEYEALALRLARDPEMLAETRARLARNRATHPLFDTSRFTRHIERAYADMSARHRRGEPPESFTARPVD